VAAVPLLIAAVALQIWSAFGLPPLIVPVYTLAVAALLVNLIISTRASTGFLARQPLVYIGTISYAVYLTHQLGLGISERLVPARAGWYGDISSLAIGLALAIALCALLHRWVETPMIARGRRLGSILAARKDGNQLVSRTGVAVAGSQGQPATPSVATSAASR
jgi:peptidoglycan/LPS O-acetylase OafA/YrhL